MAAEDLSDQLEEQLREAATRQQPVRIRGAGTHDFLGYIDPALPCIDTANHSGIVSYEPSELVVQVRSGTCLNDLLMELAAQGQTLGFEPPRYDTRATVGGCVASGIAGPARMRFGSVRDAVLGATLLDGHGRRLRFGGQVIKNVAGFDVSRLMVGAMGTLGLLLDVSFKLVPLDRESRTFQIACSAAAAISRVRELLASGLPLDASCHCEDRLYLRFSGTGATLDAAGHVVGGTSVDADADFWQSIRDQSHDFFLVDKPLWRLQVPQSTPVDPDWAGLLEWGGGQRWTYSDDPERMRAIAREAGGHATLFRCDAEVQDRFMPLDAPLLSLHQRLKLTFDPGSLLNPGRLYPAF